MSSEEDTGSNTNNEDRPGIPLGLIMFLGLLGMGLIIAGLGGDFLCG